MGATELCFGYSSNPALMGGCKLRVQCLHLDLLHFFLILIVGLVVIGILYAYILLACPRKTRIWFQLINCVETLTDNMSAIAHVLVLGVQGS